MRKLILQIQMSIDGFIGSNSNENWQLWGWGAANAWDDELKQDFVAHFSKIDTILLSRKMAEEGYLSHWGKAAQRYPQDPFYAFAKRITEMAKVVPTNKRDDAPWERTSIRTGELQDVVTALKSEAGADIGVFGGAGFASALLAKGLVDELQLYINPAVLGSGVGLFRSSGFKPMRLLSSKAYACDMVVTRYNPLS